MNKHNARAESHVGMRGQICAVLKEEISCFGGLGAYIEETSRWLMPPSWWQALCFLTMIDFSMGYRATLQASIVAQGKVLS